MRLRLASAFSLLELLLVIAVFIIILLASYSRYQNYKQIVALDAIKQNVALLQNQLNLVYGQQSLPECQQYLNDKDVTPEVLTDDIKKLLQKSQLIAPNDPYAAKILAATKEVEGFSGTCSQGNPQYVHNLQISVTLALADPSAETMQWYVNKLGASGYTATSTLFWNRMPTYSIPGIHDHLWIMEAGLEMFKRQVGS